MPLSLLSSVLRFTVFAGVFAFMVGCATYQSKPLTSTPTPAPLEHIQMPASQVANPLLPPLAVDGRDGFTPEQIAILAVISSPRLKALRDQKGVAEAQVVQAGLLPNPQLGYTMDRPYGTPGAVGAHTLGLSWEVTSLLAYRDRLAAGKSTARALDLSIAWQEWQAAEAARLSAYRILSLEERLPLVRETEAQLGDALALTREALKRGYRTTAELAATIEIWTSARDGRFALEQELATERLSLNLALGQPPETVVRLRAGAPFPEIPADAAAATRLLDGLESRRLDLVALTLGYESAEATLRAAVKAQFPKVGLSFGRARDTSDVRTRSFGVTIDLPVFDRGQGQIALGKATRQQLFDEYTERVAEARSEVMQLLANLAVAREQLRALENELPDFERLVSALDQAMKTRNADVQAWRDAHASLLGRRLLRAKLNQDLLELGVALEIATGRPSLTRAATP
jgi:outer membrane protein TolC